MNNFLGHLGQQCFVICKGSNCSAPGATLCHHRNQNHEPLPGEHKCAERTNKMEKQQLVSTDYSRDATNRNDLDEWCNLLQLVIDFFASITTSTSTSRSTQIKLFATHQAPNMRLKRAMDSSDHNSDLQIGSLARPWKNCLFKSSYQFRVDFFQTAWPSALGRHKCRNFRAASTTTWWHVANNATRPLTCSPSRIKVSNAEQKI